MFHRLRFHCSVVDANVVDQAGEEGASGVILSNADVQTTGVIFQTCLCIFGHGDTINSKRPMRTVPHQTNEMPCSIGDDSL